MIIIIANDSSLPVQPYLSTMQLTVINSNFLIIRRLPLWYYIISHCICLQNDTFINSLNNHHLRQRYDSLFITCSSFGAPNEMQNQFISDIDWGKLCNSQNGRNIFKPFILLGRLVDFNFKFKMVITGSELGSSSCILIWWI